jgi:hypothetical protein
MAGLVNISVRTDLTIVLQIDDTHPRKMGYGYVPAEAIAVINVRL